MIYIGHIEIYQVIVAVHLQVIGKHFHKIYFFMDSNQYREGKYNLDIDHDEITKKEFDNNGVFLKV